MNGMFGKCCVVGKALVSFMGLLIYWITTSLTVENLKIRGCLIDHAAARSKPGICLIDPAANIVKSRGCLIDPAAARLKSGSCLIEQAAT